MPVACSTCMPAGNYGRSLQHRRSRLSLQSTLFSKKPSTSGGEHSAQEPEEREPVEIGSLVTTGLIQVITLDNEAEAITFIDLASEMDDGEAMTCALAMHRECDVATDNRKARRVLSGVGLTTYHLQLHCEAMGRAGRHCQSGT